MITTSEQSRYPSCRPANPGACARCTLSYDCRAKADDGTAVSWPLVALALASIITVLTYAL